MRCLLSEDIFGTWSQFVWATQLSLVFVGIESKRLVFGLRIGDAQSYSFCRGVFRDDYKMCAHM